MVVGLTREWSFCMTLGGVTRLPRQKFLMLDDGGGGAAQV